MIRLKTFRGWSLSDDTFYLSDATQLIVEMVNQNVKSVFWWVNFYDAETDDALGTMWTDGTTLHTRYFTDGSEDECLLFL